MQRFTVRSLVFLCGLLAALGVERARFHSARKHEIPAQSPQNEAQSKGLDLSSQEPIRAMPAADEKLYVTTEREVRLKPPSGSRDELLQAVQAAAREGNTRSLERLNGKALSAIPEYHSIILPMLKKECLQSLLRRFSESDWIDWPRASFILEGSPTAARTYVNDVFIVNEDLGRFLETVALLFHVSYVSATEGKILQPEQALERIFSQADRLLAYRTPKAIPPRDMLDAEVLSQPFVVERLKQVQSGLVLRYIQGHPAEYGRQFELLSKLPNESITSEVSIALANLVHRFSLEASPKLRRELLESILSGHSIAERARSDARVARSLSHLFLMGVVDALEEGDARRADIYLDESYNLNPHLPAQDVVADAIREVNARALERSREAKEAKEKEQSAKSEKKEGAPLPAKSKKSDDDSALDLFAKSEKSKDSHESSFIEQAVKVLFSVLVVTLLGGGLFLFILYRRGLKASGKSSVDSNEPIDPLSLSVTSASEIPFGSPSPSGEGRSSLRAAATS